MLIYKATHISTGKIYVGSAVGTLQQRISLHYRQMRNDVKDGRPLSPFRQLLFSVAKEGLSWEVLEEVNDRIDLLKREAYWTDKLRANDPAYGFNKRTGVGNMLPANKRESWRVEGAVASNPRLSHLV